MKKFSGARVESKMQHYQYAKKDQFTYLKMKT